VGELIDTKKLAAQLKVSTDTIYRLAKTGEIPSVRVGGQLRYDPTEVRAKLTIGRG
jgi:excisionase family DNA binding protein